MERFLILSEPVMAIRSKYYIGVLLRRLGVDRVGHISKALNKLGESQGLEPYCRYRCDFYRYWHGENIKNECLEDAVNEVLPGTARIIRHPIWPLLSKEFTSKKELISLAERIEPGLRGCILGYDEHTQDVMFKNYSGSNWLFNTTSKFMKMIDRRGLDELAALLLIMRAHEFQGDYGVSLRVRKIIVRYFIEISRVSEFKPIASQLYLQVYGLFVGNTYKHPCKGEVMYDAVQNARASSLNYVLWTIGQSKRRMGDSDAYSHILKRNRLQRP
jgi:hypothetical protein